MILIEPSYEILSVPENLKLIEKAGRVCWKSEDKITEDSYKKFISGIVKKGHGSVIEHLSATVKFICDRGVLAELTRHRLCSFSVESSRYNNYHTDVTFIIPPWVDIKPNKFDITQEIMYASYIEGIEEGFKSDGDCAWFWSMAIAERNYKKLINKGWSAQEARSVLPNSLKTEIIMTANLREWKHIFKLRTSPQAHPQMREILIPLEIAFKGIFPEIFATDML
jgi:thymidylate synthase (FAD)